MFVVEVFRIDVLWERAWNPHWILKDHKKIVGGLEELDQLADVGAIDKIDESGGLLENMGAFHLVKFGVQKYLQRVGFFLPVDQVAVSVG